MLVMVIDLCGFTRGDREVFFSKTRRTAATPFWTCGVKAPDDDDDVVVVLCANIFGRISALLRSKKVNNSGRERVVLCLVFFSSMSRAASGPPPPGWFVPSSLQKRITQNQEEKKMKCFLPRWSHKKCLLSLHKTQKDKAKRGGEKNTQKKKGASERRQRGKKIHFCVLFPLLSLILRRDTLFERERERERERDCACKCFQKECLSLSPHGGCLSFVVVVVVDGEGGGQRGPPDNDRVARARRGGAPLFLSRVFVFFFFSSSSFQMRIDWIGHRLYIHASSLSLFACT